MALRQQDARDLYWRVSVLENGQFNIKGEDPLEVDIWWYFTVNVINAVVILGISLNTTDQLHV